MNENINIAELLKDCPKGMELNCTMWDNVEFDHIDIKSNYPIYIKKSSGEIEYLTENGCFNFDLGAKCVIFPKGKTTWKGFIPPCKFNAGDVLVSESGDIVLFSHIDSNNFVHYHCIILRYGSFRIEENTNIGVGRYYDCVLANEQQRQRMYDKIKCLGYKYNQSINKLKLISPKFKDGDIVAACDGEYIAIIKNNDGEYYVCCHLNSNYFNINQSGWFDRLATEEEKQKLLQIIKNHGYKWNNQAKKLEVLITPKFKVGDIIQDKDSYKVKITAINEDGFYEYDSLIPKGIGVILFEEQDNWTLAEYQVGDYGISPYKEIYHITSIINPHYVNVTHLDNGKMLSYPIEKLTKIDKYPIDHFKPFDKVLVRFNNTHKWCTELFSHLVYSSIGKFQVTNNIYNQCIPYNEETKHLVGTTQKASEFYTNW